MAEMLKGVRHVIERGAKQYPKSFEDLTKPPESLYVIGNPDALREGLAVIGARKATPYGRSCAKRFAGIAAKHGIPIVSGGAKGCDSASHMAALEVGGLTVAFLGGGCDKIYPASNFGLFQDVIARGGAIVSEHPWSFAPRPYAFRERNRLIAALAKAVLIVEAGLPSGTFTTADEALSLGKEVLVIPGAITSESSRGSNRLLYQGATPIVDDETFEDVISRCFGGLRQEKAVNAANSLDGDKAMLLEAIRAAPIDMDGLCEYASEVHGSVGVREWLMESLVEFESAGLVARQLDGKWGPNVREDLLV